MFFFLVLGGSFYGLVLKVFLFVFVGDFFVIKYLVFDWVFLGFFCLGRNIVFILWLNGDKLLFFKNSWRLYKYLRFRVLF